MKLDLTKEQEKQVALHWIRETADYKTIIDTLFAYGTCSSKWPWTDALTYAVKVCGKNFASKKSWILEQLK